jgi:hypothetical protein
MTSAIKSREWMPAVLLASLYLCLVEQALAAPVSFSISSSSAPVYDLTGSYRFDQQSFAAGGIRAGLSLSLSVTQDATGRLQGSGLTSVGIGDESYPATYLVTGKVSGGGKVTRATLVARLQGQDPAGDVDPSLAISVQYNLVVSRGALKGTARGSAELPKLGSGSIRSLISGVPLPAGVDGSWSVQMDMLALSKPGGTGSIIFPNGRILQTSLAGSPSTPLGLERIRLSGTNGNEGSRLNINFFPRTSALQSLSGRILGQTVSGTFASSQYIGSQACIECHGVLHQTFMSTLHAQVGVQCESCHGPAADHAANYYDPVVRPKVDLMGTSCGVCHSGTNHPTYEEWSSSGHASVVEGIVLTNLVNNCGWCHSGSVRVSLLDGLQLPAGGADVPIGCPTCHETHRTTTNSALLRNPIASTNDYFLSLSDNFTNEYDPGISLCAQCHNHRGASWTNTVDAPHRSPQYNFLLGSIGELTTGSATYNPASHAGLPASAQYSLSGAFYLTNQCVSCHMQNDAAPANIPSHTFNVDTYDVCLNCHVFDPELLVQLVAVPAISNRVYQLKYGLDLWANTKAPASLRADGMLAWEYTNPGGLIWQTNNGVISWMVADQVNFKGPDAAGQTLIPDTIKKARFNMYLVLGDGSYGVHNPYFALDLLEAAADWVSQELNN